MKYFILLITTPHTHTHTHTHTHITTLYTRSMCIDIHTIACTILFIPLHTAAFNDNMLILSTLICITSVTSDDDN